MVAWSGLAVLLLGLAWACSRRLQVGAYGRVVHAVREDDAFAQSLGVNTWATKSSVFIVSGMLAGTAGSIYAHYLTFVEPGNFGIMESFLIVFMVVVGGPATRWGPMVGAAVFVLLPEGLRFIGFPSTLAANLRQVLFGGLLVVIVVLRPHGTAKRGDRQ